MCGRYASSSDPDALIEEFEVARDATTHRLEPDFNVAPTKEVYAVLTRPPKHERPEAERQLRVLTWGLIPSWARDSTMARRLINARVETVAEKPAFRRAFAARRCLIPADGYFEWYPMQQLTASGKPRKQPFFIRPRDGGTLAMAGLYEIWRDPAVPDDAAQTFRWTCTILTTRAEDALGQIHDRMPLMVDARDRDAWLDPSIKQGDELFTLLTPATPGSLEAYPVSTLVSNVRNNGPELIVPLPPEHVSLEEPQ